MSATTLAGSRGTREVALRLAGLLGRAPQGVPLLQPLDARPVPRRVVAVDGSNVTLAEGGEHLLGAYRHGRVLLEGGQPLPEDAAAPEVVLLTPHEGRERLREALARAGFPDADVPPLSNAQCLETLRTLAELACAEESLRLLGRDDALLLDGALQARAAAPLLDRLVPAAKARGVDLVGVCKSTSLTIGPVPALVACQLAGRAFPAKTWHARLPAPPMVRGEVHVARLSAGEERVFRFDVAAHDGDAARVLGALASLSGHPAYPGYPSPLAMAHNAALLTEDAKRRLRAEVQEAAVRAGVPEEAWMAAFFDYHDVLELGA